MRRIPKFFFYTLDKLLRLSLAVHLLQCTDKARFFDNYFLAIILADSIQRLHLRLAFSSSFNYIIEREAVRKHACVFIFVFPCNIVTLSSVF